MSDFGHQQRFAETLPPCAHRSSSSRKLAKADELLHPARLAGSCSCRPLSVVRRRLLQARSVRHEGLLKRGVLSAWLELGSGSLSLLNLRCFSRLLVPSELWIIPTAGTSCVLLHSLVGPAVALAVGAAYCVATSYACKRGVLLARSLLAAH